MLAAGQHQPPRLPSQNLFDPHGIRRGTGWPTNRAPLRCTPMTESIMWGSTLRKALSRNIPALLTRMSTRPNASSADLQIAAPRVAVTTVSWLAGAGQAHPLRQPEVRRVTVIPMVCPDWDTPTNRHVDRPIGPPRRRSSTQLCFVVPKAFVSHRNSCPIPSPTHASPKPGLSGATIARTPRPESSAVPSRHPHHCHERTRQLRCTFSSMAAPGLTNGTFPLG